jgi:peptidoglycan hydrolase-like protein with peptidoglycan-binding domain
MKISRGAMALVVALALAAAPPLAQAQTSSGSTSSDTMKSSDMKSSKGGARGGAGMAANTGQVKAAQQALKDQGLDPGPIDGKMGPKTKAALRDYQQKQGLKATGRLDTETASKLGVEKTSSGSSSTSPAASPSTSAPSSSDTKAKSTDSKK